MAIIRATCANCGDLELTTADLRARCCLDNDRSEYRFTCTTCNTITVKETRPDVLELLASGGVEVEYWKLPRELFEERSGDVISHNDIIAFHRAISDEDAFMDALESQF